MRKWEVPDPEREREREREGGGREADICNAVMWLQPQVGQQQSAVTGRSRGRM